MNQELLDVQAGFRKGRGTRAQIANTCWIIQKAREFQKKKQKPTKKKYLFLITDYANAFDCVDHKKLWKILKRETYMQVRKQQLELDMKQQTGSK